LRPQSLSPIPDRRAASLVAQYAVSYAYHAMWAYFSRDDVALPGLAAWFAACSLEERDHGAP
jgi:ferritin heavy chain